MAGGRTVRNGDEGTSGAAPAIPRELTDTLQKMAEVLVRQQPARLSYFERFQRVNYPVFMGGPDPLEAERWIVGIEEKFVSLEFPEDAWLRVAIPHLAGNAKFWWDTAKLAEESVDAPVTWERFKKLFLDHFFPASIKTAKHLDFLSLN